MYYPERMATGEPAVHRCPEPFTLEHAQAFVEFAVASKLPQHPRDKARAVLAYKAAGLR
jgi:hypothetical protein